MPVTAETDRPGFVYLFGVVSDLINAYTLLYNGADIIKQQAHFILFMIFFIGTTVG